jgi:hypothetical protein
LTKQFQEQGLLVEVSHDDRKESVTISILPPTSSGTREPLHVLPCKTTDVGRGPQIPFGPVVGYAARSDCHYRPAGGGMNGAMALRPIAASSARRVEAAQQAYKSHFPLQSAHGSKRVACLIGGTGPLHTTARPSTLVDALVDFSATAKMPHKPYKGKQVQAGGKQKNPPRCPKWRLCVSPIDSSRLLPRTVVQNRYRSK